MNGGPTSGTTRTRRLVRWSLVVLGAVLSALAAYYWSHRSPASQHSTQLDNSSRATVLPAGSDAGYVDAAACSGCHREIWKQYQQTGMARSLARLHPQAVIEDFKRSNTFYHKASDSHFTMYEKEGKYYQRRHEIGFDGKQTNIVEKEIHFGVGSGNHARSYLHRTPEGRLFELPVAWYTEKSGFWAMNPGYDHPNHLGFRREITAECVFCHTAYPEIEPGSDRFGRETRFPGRIPEGIDCQRCHGPGRDHIAAAGRGDANAVRGTIVNPSRLSPEAQLDLCMQCHLETTSSRLPHSIPRLDRGVFSYRPGEPLAAYALHFDHAPGAGYDDKFEIAHQAYRLRKSACFVKSNGRLTCTTCHDAHEAPRGPQAVEQYTSACRQCHSSQLKVEIAKGRHTSEANCLGCHMPKRRTDDVIHAVMTDHYIQRRKPARDLLAPLQERHDTDETAYRGPVVPYYPKELPPGGESELYLAMAQVKQFSNLKEGIPKLTAALDRHQPKDAEFYFELAEAHAQTNQLAEAVRRYEQAVDRNADFRPAWAGLGRVLSKLGQNDRAAQALARALELNPRDARILNDLGLIHLRQGNLQEAAVTFRRAINADPDFAEAHSNLGGALAQSGDLAGAEASYREAVRLQPDFAGAHRNLGNLVAARGDLAQAVFHFRKAVYHNAGYAEAFQDYGTALASMERYSEARVQFEAALRLNPNLATAQSALADTLALQGMTAGAIPHYERALSIDPAMGSARLGLGSALASQGRIREAVSHLNQAAQSRDPAIREGAYSVLQAIDKKAKPF